MTTRDRKNSLKALFSGEIAPPAAGPATGEGRAPETKSAESLTSIPDAPSPAQGSQQPGRAASGAVKAMGLSLSSITREAEEARALRDALSQGEHIISLDPERIEASFVADRLSDEERDDPDFLALVESIRENGQQVPILVRPLGEGQDRYQVAYGHRRMKAARRLGRPVRAIIKALDDDQLVLAQGKENAERRNLSFIERAMFAHALTHRGFDRRLVGEALGVQKSELSRLLQVAEAIPLSVMRAIGPAPKTGRPRWLALAELFQAGKGAAIEKALDEIAGDVFRAAESDRRFQMVFDRLSRRKPAEAAESETDVATPDGAVFARLTRRGRGVTIRFEAGTDENFIASLGGELASAYADWLARSGGGKHRRGRSE